MPCTAPVAMPSSVLATMLSNVQSNILSAMAVQTPKAMPAMYNLICPVLCKYKHPEPCQANALRCTLCHAQHWSSINAQHCDI
eukprot:10231265-Ditylum_brightwellii.AAC.1